jgi:hypothetical protein
MSPHDGKRETQRREKGKEAYRGAENGDDTRKRIFLQSTKMFVLFGVRVLKINLYVWLQRGWRVESRLRNKIKSGTGDSE